MNSSSLSSFPLVEGTVYGPVVSRRFGRSLGINLLPSGVKVCGFNCNYCQLGWTTELVDAETLARRTWPSPAEIAMQLREALAAGTPLDSITLSGNGEPTLHPEFLDACRAVVDERDRSRPGLPVGILTNGATMGDARVVEGLNLLDERYVKLDAGSQRMFLTMNSPTFDVTIQEIVEGTRRLRDCVVQSMFTQGRRDNTGERDVGDWIQSVQQVAPKSVQIYSLARIPADPKVTVVEETLLQGIAGRLRAETGLRCEVVSWEAP